MVAPSPIDLLAQGRVAVFGRDGDMLGSLPRPPGPPRTAYEIALLEEIDWLAGGAGVDPIGPLPMRSIRLDTIHAAVADGWIVVRALRADDEIHHLRRIDGWREPDGRP